MDVLGEDASQDEAFAFANDVLKTRSAALLKSSTSKLW